MAGCMFVVKACLILIMSCLRVVTSQDLRLSSFPSRPSRGQNVTLICRATFNIGTDPIVWVEGGSQVLDTRRSGAHINTPGILTGKWYMSTESHTHNLTITLNSGDILGPWTCRSDPKGVTSNELMVDFDSTTSTGEPSTINTAPVDMSTSSAPEHRTIQSSTKQTSHSGDVSKETVYISVGSSVAVNVLITVIAFTVCYILKKKRRDKAKNKAVEESVTYENI